MRPILGCWRPSAGCEAARRSIIACFRISAPIATLDALFTQAIAWLVHKDVVRGRRASLGVQVGSEGSGSAGPSEPMRRQVEERSGGKVFTTAVISDNL
jgi:hypothetical protein